MTHCTEKDFIMGIQEEYLTTRSSEKLGSLYISFVELAHIVLGGFLRSKKLYLTNERKEDLVSDSVSYFIGRYLSDPEFRIQDSPYSLFYRDIKTRLFGDYQQRRDKSETLVWSLPYDYGVDTDPLQNILYDELIDQIIKTLDWETEKHGFLFLDDGKQIMYGMVLDFIERSRNDYRSHLYALTRSNRWLAECGVEAVRNLIQEYGQFDETKNENLLIDKLTDKLQRLIHA
jgi:hypothetical protein